MLLQQGQQALDYLLHTYAAKSGAQYAASATQPESDSRYEIAHMAIAV